TFLLPGELMKDPAQARANLAIHRFATVLRNKHHVLLALPARMRQALPRFCHTVLLRICQQAILGGLYSRIAQSSSSRTRPPSGLPPLESYQRPQQSQSLIPGTSPFRGNGSQDGAVGVPSIPNALREPSHNP